MLQIKATGYFFAKVSSAYRPTMPVTLIPLSLDKHVDETGLHVTLYTPLFDTV